MKEKIVKILNLDSDQVLLDKKIPKVKFYNQEDFNKGEEKIFTRDIDNIYLLSVLNEDTINIHPYVTDECNYSELYFIYIELRTKESYSKITEAVHSILPNPVVLILVFGDKINISTATKRINKSDKTKQIIDEYNISNWIDAVNPDKDDKLFLEAVNIKNLTFENFYKLYVDFSNRVYMVGLVELLGAYIFSRKLDMAGIKKLFSKYQQLDIEINRLKSKEKETLNFGDKVAIHSATTGEEKKQNNIKNKILEIINNAK